MTTDQDKDPTQDGIKLDLTLKTFAGGGTLGRLERASEIVDALATLAAPKAGQQLSERMAAILKWTIEDAIVQIR